MALPWTINSGTQSLNGGQGVATLISLNGTNHATFTPEVSPGWYMGVISGAAFPATFGNTISGTARAGATVTYSGAASGSVLANGLGVYTISGLGNGSYTITPSLVNFTFTPPSSSQVISGSDITGVNFVATAAPTYSVPDDRTLPGFPNLPVMCRAPRRMMSRALRRTPSRWTRGSRPISQLTPAPPEISRETRVRLFLKA